MTNKLNKVREKTKISLSSIGELVEMVDVLGGELVFEHNGKYYKIQSVTNSSKT